MNRPRSRANACAAPFCASQGLVPTPCSEREHLYMLPLLHAVDAHCEGNCEDCERVENTGRRRTGARNTPAVPRWPIVVALLADPERESARLALLLDPLPCDVRRHFIVDDCLRRAKGSRRSSWPVVVRRYASADDRSQFACSGVRVLLPSVLEQEDREP